MSESNDRRPAVVINQAAASRMFPGDEAVGKEVWIGGQLSVATIVGVVGNERFNGPAGDADLALYRPHGPLGVRGTTARVYIAIRSAADPGTLVQAIRAQLHAVDPEQAIRKLTTMEDAIAASLGRPRFQSFVLGTFAVLALVMAAVGLYGVLSFAVAERTHEVGIRLALGAQAGMVVRSLVLEGLALAVGGIAIGLTGAILLTRLLSRLLFETSPTDPATFGATALLILVVAAVASWLPASRATRLSPLTALYR
jgi:ABC-type antimicrobial peptide transport system permease subunit